MCIEKLNRVTKVYSCIGKIRLPYYVESTSIQCQQSGVNGYTVSENMK